MKKLTILMVLFISTLINQSNAIRLGLFNGDFKGWTRGTPLGGRRSYRPVWINISPVTNHNFYHRPPSAMEIKAKLSPPFNKSPDLNLARKAAPLENTKEFFYTKLSDAKNNLRKSNTLSDFRQRSSIDTTMSCSQSVPSANLFQSPREFIKSRLVQNVVESLPEFKDPGEELKFYVQLRRVLQNIKKGVVSQDSLMSVRSLQQKKSSEVINPLLIGRSSKVGLPVLENRRIQSLLPKRNSPLLGRPVNMLGSASNANLARVSLFEDRNGLFRSANNRQNVLAKFKDLVMRVLNVLQELYRE